jgi:hypothetical protein
MTLAFVATRLLLCLFVGWTVYQFTANYETAVIVTVFVWLLFKIADYVLR